MMETGGGDDERINKLHRDRGLLVDGVQVARLRHELTRIRYDRGVETSSAVLNSRDLLEEAEAALRAHIEVYGELK